MNKIVLIILINIPTLGYSQVDNYTIVPIDSITLDSFKYGADIKSFLDQFGNPKNYKEYSDLYPLEGYGKTYYIEYDSLKATFVEFYGKIILSSITITGSKYLIRMGKSSFIQIGDSLKRLQQFEKSYAFFLNQYQLPYKDKEQYYYINVTIHQYAKNG